MPVEGVEIEKLNSETGEYSVVNALHRGSPHFSSPISADCNSLVLLVVMRRRMLKILK